MTPPWPPLSGERGLNADATGEPTCAVGAPPAPGGTGTAAKALGDAREGIGRRAPDAAPSACGTGGTREAGPPAKDAAATGADPEAAAALARSAAAAFVAAGCSTRSAAPSACGTCKRPERPAKAASPTAAIASTAPAGIAPNLTRTLKATAVTAAPPSTNGGGGILTRPSTSEGMAPGTGADALKSGCTPEAAAAAAETVPAAEAGAST